jgi:tetratricopeptide (TPR) repeat protein
MPQLTYSIAKPECANDDILALAKVKYRAQDYDGAIDLYTRAIVQWKGSAKEYNPEHALALCCRGVAYYRLKNGHGAMADYNRAIEIDPNLAIAYYRRGFLHYVTKNYVSAIADYNRAIEIDPQFALAYSNRGYAYRELYGAAEATIDLRFAAKLFEQQGNMKKFHSTMELINEISDGDTWASGML